MAQLTFPLSPSTAAAQRFIQFINASPTPYHAVKNAVDRLERAGFVRLREREEWTRTGGLKWGGRYFVTRNQSSIIAFTLPSKPSTPESLASLGVSIVGAHTDSPCLKLKPISKKEKLGWEEVGVETYGGGLWHTWLDRDLGIAGRVIVASPSSSSTAPSFSTHLIQSHRPILRIPTVAIHLDRTQNDAMKYNPETQMVPLLSDNPSAAIEHVCSHGKHQMDAAKKAGLDLDAAGKLLSGTGAGTGNGWEVVENKDGESEKKVSSGSVDPLDIATKHHPLLLHLVCEALSSEATSTPLSTSSSSRNASPIQPSQIHSLDLSLYDTHPSTLGGPRGEYILSARLDNLFSSYCAVEGLVESVEQHSEADSKAKVNLIALWDNEEVGSVSAYGAESNFLESILKRLSVVKLDESEGDVVGAEVGKGAEFEQLLANSFLVSCDMAHAVHPSFPEKHEEQHRPRMNQGPAIKTNAKQRYATTAQTDFLLRRVAALGGVNTQDYVVRNDMPCGSTIGPLVSKIGLRTVDIGCPQLSMHSIREMAGSEDVETLTRLFKTFFARFGEVDVYGKSAEGQEGSQVLGIAGDE